MGHGLYASYGMGILDIISQELNNWKRLVKEIPDNPLSSKVDDETKKMGQELKDLKERLEKIK